MGLRRGEILGLKWEHIDFEKATLSIENTRTMVGKNIVEKSPKTERSTRQLLLDTPLLQLLSEHKAKRRKNINHDYVVTKDNGSPFKPNYLSESFHKHLQRYNMKAIRFHDLRHSCASLMLYNKEDMKRIQAWLGHSTISITADTYSHLEFTSKVDSGDRISDSLLA
jgi:integrase